MTKATEINDVFITYKKSMLPVRKGILSIDTEEAINVFRKAIKAEEKSLKESRPSLKGNKDKLTS